MRNVRFEAGRRRRRHQTKPDPLYDKSGNPHKAPCYTPADFHPLTPVGRHLHVPGREVTLPEHGIELSHQWSRSRSLPRGKANDMRRRAKYSRPLSAHTRQDASPGKSRSLMTSNSDARDDRLAMRMRERMLDSGRWTQAIRAALRYSRAGIRQPETQQTTQSIHATQQAQG